jgi:hypothetical protein
VPKVTSAGGADPGHAPEIEQLDRVWPWPEYPAFPQNADLSEALFAAQLAERAAQRRGEAERLKLHRDTENEYFKNLHSSLREVAKGKAERAQSLADFVQKSAGAVVALYTGLLALAFTAGDNPLPARGMIPALFLGGAYLLSTAYAAFLLSPGTMSYRPGRTPRENVIRQTGFFIRWVHAASLKRVTLLRGAVVSLGVGIALLPLPFLAVDDTALGAAVQSSPTPTPTATGTPPSASVLPSSPDWPPIPSGLTDESEAELHVILFEAQVREVETLRSKENAAKSLITGFRRTDWIVLFIGVGIVLATLAASAAERSLRNDEAE